MTAEELVHDPLQSAGEPSALVRGAATVYISITGVVDACCSATSTLAYLAYTLVRGTQVDWYPYPFLNPDPHGYGYVAVMSVCVAIAAAVFVALVAGATRLPGRMVHWRS